MSVAEWISGDSLKDVIDPGTLQSVFETAQCGVDIVNICINHAEQARSDWQSRLPVDRGLILRKWAKLIRKNTDDLAVIISVEQGKPLFESKGEVEYGASFLDWFAAEGERTLGQSVPSHKPNMLTTNYAQPVGIALAITPWNFPLAMITRKAGAALAAGCPMIVKPAAETPLSANALAVLAAEAGIPGGVFQVIQGDAPTLCAALLKRSEIRALSFMGSTRVGQILLEQAAGTIKLAKVRAAMEVADCGVLLVTDPASMAWLTGYDGWSFYVHQAVLIGPSGAPLWWGRAMDALGAKRTVYMAADNIFGYEDTFVQNPDKHPMEDLAQLIKARGWSASQTGLEMDNYYFTAAAFMSLVQELPDAKWVNANVLVNWQRAVKSTAEIKYMRRAAKIVEKMHATILERAEPGMKKNQLIADNYHAAITGADGYWGDYPSIVPLAPSGEDATAPHLTWDDNALQKGEATFFEIAGVYRRYHAPQSRTLFFAEPPAKYRAAEAAVLEAVAAGMKQAKPGNFAEDIANAFNATLNRLGFEKDSRCGYPIGLSYPPDWGEHTYSLRRNDKTLLEPGMTFHFMPALWLDDGGIEMTEPVLITETGAENLCSTPSGLVVKE